MRRCVADFGFFFCWRPGFRATPASSAGFALEDTGATPREQSAATQDLPNQSMPVARPGVSSGVPRRPPGEAAILHTADIGTIISTGAEMRLPGDATSLVTGPCQMARELEIKVAASGAEIDGAVALSGLPKALQSPNAECGQK